VKTTATKVVSQIEMGTSLGSGAATRRGARLERACTIRLSLQVFVVAVMTMMEQAKAVTQNKAMQN
jgi:hypothetical protein